MAGNQRYPLATPDGQAIPLEVINPKGIIRIPFTTISGTALCSIPDGTELVSVFTSAECFIYFNKVAEFPGDNVYIPGVIHVPRSVGIVFAPTTLNISIIGSQSSGTALLQLHEQWAGLALKQQYQYR